MQFGACPTSSGPRDSSSRSRLFSREIFLAHLDFSSQPVTASGFPRIGESMTVLPYYMKFSRHVNFANFAIPKKSRNLSDAKIKCRENNMT